MAFMLLEIAAELALILSEFVLIPSLIAKIEAVIALMLAMSVERAAD